jgi:hypothetical protein
VQEFSLSVKIGAAQIKTALGTAQLAAELFQFRGTIWAKALWMP